jgi:hypothetical protein
MNAHYLRWNTQNMLISWRQVFMWRWTDGLKWLIDSGNPPPGSRPVTLWTQNIVLEKYQPLKGGHIKKTHRLNWGHTKWTASAWGVMTGFGDAGDDNTWRLKYLHFFRYFISVLILLSLCLIYCSPTLFLPFLRATHFTYHSFLSASLDTSSYLSLPLMHLNSSSLCYLYKMHHIQSNKVQSIVSRYSIVQYLVDFPLLPTCSQ